MKLKQVLFTVVISALTAFGVMWGYGKFVNNNTYAGQTGDSSTQLQICKAE